MKNLNLIRNIAWSFHITTNIDYEELFAEASLGYCEALNTYISGNNKLSSWAWVVMKNRLLNFIKKEKKHKTIDYFDCPEELRFNEFVFEQPVPFYEVFEQLNYDSKKIVKIMLEFAESKNTFSSISKKTREELRKEGWSWPRIWNGIREIKTTLN